MMPHLSRRDFLTSLASSSFLFFSFPAWARIGLRAPGEKTVLVVGAGISGLYAASLLEAKGYKVEILEAAPHAGGKLIGRKVGEHLFDLGGQGLSLEMKRVDKLGKSLGLTRIPRPKQKQVFVFGGKKISGKKVEAAWKEVYAVQTSVEKYFPKLDLPEERKKHGAATVESWLATQKLSMEAEAIFRSVFVAEWCDSPSNISFLHYLDFSRSNVGEEGEMDFRFREGFFSLAERLRAKLKGSLHLSTPADSIEVSKNRVTVTSGAKRFYADHLVLATPVPQMRGIPISGEDTKLFQDSISQFRGAAVKKAIVLYAKPFWAKQPTEGLFDPPAGFAFMDNSDEAKKVWSLAVFLGGEAAKLPKDRVLGCLAEAVGPEALNPLAYEEEDWSGTRYMTGGYGSNRKPGETGWQAVPRRVGSRIFLAGSDTSDSFPSYVEGALSAAERAVDLIVKDGVAARVAHGS